MYGTSTTTLKRINNLVRTVLVLDSIYLKYFNLNWISTNFFNMFLVISIFSSLCLLVI